MPGETGFSSASTLPGVRLPPDISGCRQNDRKTCRDRADDCQDGINLPETHCHRSEKARSQNSVIGIKDTTPGTFHPYIPADDFLDLASGALPVIDEDGLACNYRKWRRFLAKNFVVVEHVEQGNTQA